MNMLCDALIRKQITICASSTIPTMTMVVPTEYQMLKEGVYTLAPELFRHSYSTDFPQWDMSEQTRLLNIEGYSNTFVDVVGRLFIRSVICSNRLLQQINRWIK